MKRQFFMVMFAATFGSVASAQQPYFNGGPYGNGGQYVDDGQYVDNGQYLDGGQYADGGQFMGAGSVGSNEQLYYYNDPERWKHGYIKMMPYHHGFHSFRPYNYHHVFGQSTTAQGFGMSPVMPYSQQFWHKYEHMADLSQGNHEPVYPGTPPVEENSHYPKPIKQPDAPGIPSASQISPQLAPQGYAPQGLAPRGYGIAPGRQQQNYSQIFQPTQQIAPVQYQNSVPQLRGPSLPALGSRY